MASRTFLCLLLCIGCIYVRAEEDAEPHEEHDLKTEVEELKKNISALWTYVHVFHHSMAHHLEHLHHHQQQAEAKFHHLMHHGSTGGHEEHSNHSEGDEGKTDHSGHHHHDEHHDAHQHDHHHHHHHGNETEGTEETHHASHDQHDHKDSPEQHDHHKDSHEQHDHHKDSHEQHDHHKDSHEQHDHHKDSHEQHDHKDSHEEKHDHKDSHEEKHDHKESGEEEHEHKDPREDDKKKHEHHHHHHHGSSDHGHGSSDHGHGSSDHGHGSSDHGHEAHRLNLFNFDAHRHPHGEEPLSKQLFNHPKSKDISLYNFATCEVAPNRAIPKEKQQEIHGRINFWQLKEGGTLHLSVRLQGFKAEDHGDHHGEHSQGHVHGMHVHERGDLSDSCQSTGPHFNPPPGSVHGGPKSEIRHVGDFGNIECDDKGNTNIVLTDTVASLTGPHSILNRAMVIHENKDDLGLNKDDPESLATGNAGTRLACCVIKKVDRLPEHTPLRKSLRKTFHVHHH